MVPTSDKDAGKPGATTGAGGAPTLAGIALVLAVLVVDQEVVRYKDLAVALFVLATALLLLAAQLAHHDSHARGVSLHYSGGVMALLIAAAVIAVPQAEISAGRWVAIAVGVIGALAIALSTLHALCSRSHRAAVSAKRRIVPAESDGADQVHADTASDQDCGRDGGDDVVSVQRAPDLPQIDIAIRTFLISAITGLLMAIVALRVGKDPSRELQFVLILIAAACPAVLAFLAQKYGWRNRVFAPLLAAMGVIHWRWPWPKPPDTVGQGTASASATAGGATAAVVVLIGG